MPKITLHKAELQPARDTQKDYINNIVRLVQEEMYLIIKQKAIDLVNSGELDAHATMDFINTLDYIKGRINE